MAALAGDLSKQILGHSESVKAFRPWWDNLEDQILYGFVLTGKPETRADFFKISRFIT